MPKFENQKAEKSVPYSRSEIENQKAKVMSSYNNGRILGEDCHVHNCRDVVEHKVYCNIIDADFAVCHFHFQKNQLDKAPTREYYQNKKASDFQLQHQLKLKNEKIEKLQHQLKYKNDKMVEKDLQLKDTVPYSQLKLKNEKIKHLQNQVMIKSGKLEEKEKDIDHLLRIIHQLGQGKSIEYLRKRYEDVLEYSF